MHFAKSGLSCQILQSQPNGQKRKEKICRIVFYHLYGRLVMNFLLIFYAFNMLVASSLDIQNAWRKHTYKVNRYILVVEKLNLNFSKVVYPGYHLCGGKMISKKKKACICNLLVRTCFKHWYIKNIIIFVNPETIFFKWLHEYCN